MILVKVRYLLHPQKVRRIDVEVLCDKFTTISTFCPDNDSYDSLLLK